MGQKGTRAILPQQHDPKEYVVLIMNRSAYPNDALSAEQAFYPATEPEPGATANKEDVFQVLESSAPSKKIEAQILSYLQNGGSALLSPMLAKKVLDSLNTPKPKQAQTVANNVSLTERETLMLSYLKDGYSYNEMAGFLNISINGVRFHVKNIYRKMKIKSRGELLRSIRN
jgi:DNA-binding CsgD family transcriptional regulator